MYGQQIQNQLDQKLKKSYPKIITFRFRQFWGVNKRKELLASLQEPDFDASYQPTSTKKGNRFRLRPSNISANYLGWAKVTELCLEYSNGLMEKRGGALMDTQKESLEKSRSHIRGPRKTK
jgi:hypothetical protein